MGIVSMKERLIAFLEEKANLPGNRIEDDTPLLSGSIIDSFALVDVIQFVEREASLRVGPMDVGLHNFDSVRRILEFVSRTSRTGN